MTFVRCGRKIALLLSLQSHRMIPHRMIESNWNFLMFIVIIVAVGTLGRLKPASYLHVSSSSESYNFNKITLNWSHVVMLKWCVPGGKVAKFHRCVHSNVGIKSKLVKIRKSFNECSRTRIVWISEMNKLLPNLKNSTTLEIRNQTCTARSKPKLSRF